jgi:hypothetical protein
MTSTGVGRAKGITFCCSENDHTPIRLAAEGTDPEKKRIGRL